MTETELNEVTQFFPEEKFSELELEDQGQYLDICISHFDALKMKGTRGPWPLIIEWLEQRKLQVQMKIIKRDSEYSLLTSFSTPIPPVVIETEKE